MMDHVYFTNLAMLNSGIEIKKDFLRWYNNIGLKGLQFIWNS